MSKYYFLISLSFSSLIINWGWIFKNSHIFSKISHCILELLWNRKLWHSFVTCNLSSYDDSKVIIIRLETQRRIFVGKDRLCPWLHLALNLTNNSNEYRENTIIIFLNDTSQNLNFYIVYEENLCASI